MRNELVAKAVAENVALVAGWRYAMSMRRALSTMLLATSALVVTLAGCEDPAADAAAKQKQELEALKAQILELGAIQEKRARKCVADIESSFSKATGDKRGSLDSKPKDKMGVATAYAINGETVDQVIEAVKYVRTGRACEEVNQAYFRDYKQGKWPDVARSDARRHKHATQTLAELKKPPAATSAAIAAYWTECTKTPWKEFFGITLFSYACTLQVVWLDSTGVLLAAAAAKGKSEPDSAPSTLSESTLKDLDANTKTVALAAAAAEIIKRQSRW